MKPRQIPVLLMLTCCHLAVAETSPPGAAVSASPSIYGSPKGPLATSMIHEIQGATGASPLNVQNALIGNLDGFGPTLSTGTDLRIAFSRV